MADNGGFSLCLPSAAISHPFPFMPYLLSDRPNQSRLAHLSSVNAQQLTEVYESPVTSWGDVYVNREAQSFNLGEEWTPVLEVRMIMSTHNLHLPAFYMTSSSETLSHTARILNMPKAKEQQPKQEKAFAANLCSLLGHTH